MEGPQGLLAAQFAFLEGPCVRAVCWLRLRASCSQEAWGTKTNFTKGWFTSLLFPGELISYETVMGIWRVWV